MSDVQTGILAPVPALGRYLSFSTTPQGDLRSALLALGELADGQQLVVGLGESVVRALDRDIPGLHSFTGAVGPGLELPATPSALWCWLRGEDRGDLVHLTRAVQAAVGRALALDQVIESFRHATGRDLSGYEDGTENPTGNDAVAAAFVAGQGAGLDGGSFVAVQQWVHDFGRLEAMSPQEQDQTIGRRRSDNVELDDAPSSAHVKRTAQESFEPPAFLLRRSMPWAEGQRSGLVFVAFASSLHPFEAQLQRMIGAEDGISDAIFRFTRPVTGAYFWCPPLHNGRLDLRALGLQAHRKT
ncbi:Dyp-type peroxidase [Methylolobus aquaticus]